MTRSSIVSAALGVALAAASPALAQQNDTAAAPPSSPRADITERLVLTPPQGWQAGGRSGNQSSLVTYLFPPGQSGENWTEMLSVQVVGDARASAREVVQRVLEASRITCDAAGPSPVGEGLTNNYPVATLTITCTRGRQTGMGGLVAVKAIQGRQALYVIERMWRGPAFSRDEPPPIPSEILQEWMTFMRNVSVCDMADAARHPCPR